MKRKNKERYKEGWKDKKQGRKVEVEEKGTISRVVTKDRGGEGRQKKKERIK